jgi:hypothetical protein
MVLSLNGKECLKLDFGKDLACPLLLLLLLRTGQAGR